MGIPVYGNSTWLYNTIVSRAPLHDDATVAAPQVLGSKMAHLAGKAADSSYPASPDEADD